MKSGRSIPRLIGFSLVLGLMAGCANEFVMYHSVSGDPLLIGRRAYTSDACIEKVKADAVRLGVTFQHIHVRGNFAGRSLLWPIEKGYSCEGAIGPPQEPAGGFPIAGRIYHQGS